MHMQWKDSEDSNETIEKETEAYYEEEYSPLGVKTGNPSPATHRFGGLLIWLPAVVIVLILVYLFLPTGKDPDASTRLKEIEARLDQVEKRMLKLEGVGERVMELEKALKDDGTIGSRFEHLETSVAKRMDQVDRELIQMRKKLDEQDQKQVAAKVTTQKQATATVKASSEYHVVQKGDTLYSISRRYGISVERLRNLNKLSQNGVIHVGQKLAVK